MSLLHFAVLLPFLYTIFVPLFFKKLPRIHTGWFVIVIPLLLFVYFLTNFPVQTDSPPIVHSVPWIASAGIHFSLHLDGLALLFALIITGIGTLVVLYSIYYMSMKREALHNFYVYLLLFMGAMLGIVLSDNLMVMYVFWEATSVSSFLLIAYWYQRKKSRYGAQKAMLITVFGGFAMLLGALMIGTAAGTFSIREIIGMRETLADHALFLPAMLLILLGAFTKSAQFPFHIWLPDAMEAPTPISAFLHSATMVKAGVYLVARFTPVFGGDMNWFWIIAIVGTLTLFWGAFMAIRQTDLKALLAYSTISQLGLIMSLLGIGSLALNPDFAAEADWFEAAILAAIFHLFNHSIFKGCLFMVVGILDHETGTRDIRKLGGLMSLMPVSFTLTVIGGLSMAGLPPFSGFLSKEMFFAGVLAANTHTEQWTLWLPIAAWVASIFTFAYCLILVFKTFTGTYHPDRLDKKPHEAPIGMLIPPILLALIVVSAFFFPNLLSYSLFEPAIHSVLPGLRLPGETFYVKIKAWHGLNTELYMTIGIVVVGTLLYRTYKKWGDVYNLLPHKYTLGSLYDNGLAGAEKLSARITSTYMNGFLHSYLSYIFVFIILLVGGSFVLLDAFGYDLSTNAEIGLYEYILAGAIAVLAGFVISVTSRLTAIIAVGAVGYLVSLLFVIFRAPDLALTQLVVETITTALFLLAFYFLPKLKTEVTRIRVKISNLLISIGIGALFTLIGIAAQGSNQFKPVSEYFQNAYELSGAKNMVNAILVDFRAFDTMLESVVLFTAGIGVYTLIKLRKSRKGGQQ
ncbi:Na+/H+ antiporter subunit A [Paenibacillus sp. PAMC21692]|uniref:Na+/H+ antiporter subunit A n=1 Tax=Paenibacillus sp. PAMC21692 TaxID=2762320 RepID=UPI00164E8072|nr:Na+/H+ antiporter subunit A [Paenibacillus sp. PAMC21692]QNK57125.1 Na+/H+ antiporter subunit A [Paenibacillus sp. PAMC21692]